MTFAGLLFAVLLALSAESKPLEDAPCWTDACPVFDDDAFYVHLIPHSHDDVGWQKTPDQYYFEDVENVISSVVDALKQNPDRRFVQVETAFFKMWWERQSDRTKETVRGLIVSGQFEILGGAWSMNDEADVHYQSTIDQFTLGLRYLKDNLGECSRPRVGWQIDPFGHTREQASLFSQLGFDSFFFARLDYRDKNQRLSDKTMELVWRGSENLGNTSDIFTSVLYNHYSAPGGFCFDIVCNDEPIIDDGESPDYNYDARVESFSSYVRGQAPRYISNHILVTMGDDFRYEAAITTYINLDKLIKGFELFPQTYNDRPIKVIYSTPSCYTKAVNDYVTRNNINLQVKTDDFLPYADGPTTYWTGFYTSRPTSKRLERQSNNLLQVAKQLGAMSGDSYDNDNIDWLKEALGIMQHHDAITGTEKQHVANNYYLLLAAGAERASQAAGSVLGRLISGGPSDLELDSCLLANVSICAPSQTNTFTVIVYNPLSRVQSTIVNLPITTTDPLWVIGPSDEEVPSQVDPSLADFTFVSSVASDQTLVFAAVDIPPLGFKVYRVEVAPVPKPHVAAPPAQYVGYDGAGFEISAETGRLSSVTLNGVTLELGQDFEYYSSASSSGAYIFVPVNSTTSKIAPGPITTTLITGDVSVGVLQEFGSWARQFIRVYKDDPSYIELDWVIGPIDISDNVGKEVISKFTTTLDNAGVFYTDSNGREVLKRVRNQRGDYTYSDEEPVAGNYYPVTSKIVLRDEEQGVELAVLTDRAQGGSSVVDGELELMVHRACQSDDGRGVGENLNEQQYGRGLVVRGKHYIVVGKVEGSGGKSLAAIERDLAQRKILAPWSFVSSKDLSEELQTLAFSGLSRDLPDNVQILSLEPWGEGVVLLRLEHVLESGEDEELSQDVEVDLEGLFTQFDVTELQEMALAANIPIGEKVRLHWPGSSSDVTLPEGVSGLKVTLANMQIRTFLATVVYK